MNAAHSIAVSLCWLLYHFLLHKLKYLLHIFVCYRLSQNKVPRDVGYWWLNLCTVAPTAFCKYLFGTPCRFIYTVVYQKITRWVAKSLWRPEYCRWQCHQRAMNNQETRCWNKQLTRGASRTPNFSAHIWNQYHTEFSEKCINQNFPQKILF